jgi:hypothetical protein
VVIISFRRIAEILKRLIFLYIYKRILRNLMHVGQLDNEKLGTVISNCQQIVKNQYFPQPYIVYTYNLSLKHMISDIYLCLKCFFKTSLFTEMSVFTSSYSHIFCIRMKMLTFSVFIETFLIYLYEYFKLKFNCCLLKKQFYCFVLPYFRCNYMYTCIL